MRAPGDVEEAVDIESAASGRGFRNKPGPLVAHVHERAVCEVPLLRGAIERDAWRRVEGLIERAARQVLSVLHGGIEARNPWELERDTCDHAHRHADVLGRVLTERRVILRANPGAAWAGRRRRWQAPGPTSRTVCPPFDSRQDANAFNQPLSFDISSVTDFGNMFWVRCSPLP